MADRRRIAVLVETSHASARESLRGVLAYIRSSGARWQIDHEPRRLENGPPEWLRPWHGAGIIVRAGVPAVEILSVARHPSVPMVVYDEFAVSRLAVEHLVSSGLRSFAFVGVKNMYWSDCRRRGFDAAVAALGQESRVFEFPRHQRLTVPPQDRVAQLAAWLRHQPLPLGIVAANDQYAALTAAGCQAAGIEVPDQVAITGVDNGEVFCELSSPPITSVMLDHFTMGFEAAKLLAARMEGGGPRPPKSGSAAAADWVALELPPLGIVERRSTAFRSAPDADVTAALRLIRDHFHEPLTVGDVAEKLAVSRATLVRRFAAVLGHGFHDELVNERLREAQRLLKHTDLPFETVAANSGFGYPQQMSRVFRSRVGVSPGGWRAANRQSRKA
jgi:LacI family transcriptional regulator